MSMFDPKTRTETHSNARLFALYEIIYTLVDFAAAFLFLIGSICFALKPTIRLTREIHYFRIGQVDELAKRAEG
jgi:hypothetical protein